MREDIAILAGSRAWGDTRASWLARVPSVVKRTLGTNRETVSYRMVKALWYGEVTDQDHAAWRDIRRAGAILRAHAEARQMAEQLKSAMQQVHPQAGDTYRSEIARLERIASLLAAGGGGDF